MKSLLHNKKPGLTAGFCFSLTVGLLAEEGVFLLEARDATAAVEDCALRTGPGGVGLWINIEVHRVAGFAIG